MKLGKLSASPVLYFDAISSILEDVLNRLLQKNKVMPSKLTGILYQRLLVKYFQFYLNYEKRDDKISVIPLNQIDEKFKQPKKAIIKKKAYIIKERIYLDHGKRINFIKQKLQQNLILILNHVLLLV